MDCSPNTVKLPEVGLRTPILIGVVSAGSVASVTAGAAVVTVGAAVVVVCWLASVVVVVSDPDVPQATRIRLRAPIIAVARNRAALSLNILTRTTSSIGLSLSNVDS